MQQRMGVVHRYGTKAAGGGIDAAKGWWGTGYQEKGLNVGGGELGV